MVELGADVDRRICVEKESEEKLGAEERLESLLAANGRFFVEVATFLGGLGLDVTARDIDAERDPKVRAKTRPTMHDLIRDCGDTNCILRDRSLPSGQRTNGGCRHVTGDHHETRALVRSLAYEIARLRDENRMQRLTLDGARRRPRPTRGAF